MSVKIKLIKEVRLENDVLLVGLPGMGYVAKTVADFIINNLGGELFAKIYSYAFPPQILVGYDGIGRLPKAYLYKVNNMVIFTGDAQPLSPEAQNELSHEVIKKLIDLGGLSKVIAGAAYVESAMPEERKVYVVGNDLRIINEFKKLGAQVLNEGVISGINGAIIGWAGYYDIPAVTLLGETWSVIVDSNMTDYRAAKAILKILCRYLNLDLNLSELDMRANDVESKIREYYREMISQMRREEGRRRGIMHTM
ncbi:MAG: hypothetical protein DRO18_00445 [Thermoprotei archaeon]|nr:MAG: hypothetical protein DRO18_00445 [Thermoprotei archaeon]